MFILGKEKLLSTDDSTRQIPLLQASFLFENKTNKQTNKKTKKRQAHFLKYSPLS